MIEGCIICANGNDLPDGEHCRACGREGLATGLRAAVIKARGRQEPPTTPVKFACPCSHPSFCEEYGKCWDNWAKNRHFEHGD